MERRGGRKQERENTDRRRSNEGNNRKRAREARKEKKRGTHKHKQNDKVWYLETTNEHAPRRNEDKDGSWILMNKRGGDEPKQQAEW